MSAKTVGYALAAVMAGAMALALCFLGYQWTVGPVDARTVYLPGKDFKSVVGQSQIDGDRRVVTGLVGESPRRQAVLSLEHQLDSDEYRYVTVDSSQLPPQLEVTLFWREPAEKQGDGLFSQPLPSDVTGLITMDMGLNPAWGGRLSEIGLLLLGDSDSLPVSLAGITLQGEGIGSAAGSLLTQWTGFRRFDQATVNRLLATFSPGAASPVPLAALWAAISLSLLLAWRLAGKLVPRHTGVLVVLIVWIALDLLWQRQLSAQLTFSQHLFQGRSMAARHARDIDRGLYEYAMELKERGLPASPARLFILHNSYGHNYQRLKMQYYLLPHNIYNLTTLPPGDALREGDYVLALQPLPGVEFHSVRSLLRWAGGPPLAVTLEHSHPMGKLFRIGPATTTPPIPADEDRSP